VNEIAHHLLHTGGFEDLCYGVLWDQGALKLG
jgi:hypothetical protein